MDEYTWSQKKDLLAEVIEDEWIVFDQECDRYFRLNNIASRIWELCENKTAQEIAAVVSAEYDVELERVQSDTIFCLNSMLRIDLVTRSQNRQETKSY